MTPTPKLIELIRGPVAVFLTVAFLPAWILFLVPVLFRLVGLEISNYVTLGAWSIAMWMPGIGALLASRREEGGALKALKIHRLGKKTIYLWAWLVPILVSVAAGLITWLLGWGEFDTELKAFQAATEALPETADISLTLLLAAQIGGALTAAPLVNTLFAMGEELGWRGFLLPKLLPLGHLPAILLSGVVWGVWHAPAIAQGHNYPGYPLIGMGMMTVFTVLLGVFFSWLYLKTNSPWAPALAHGTINAVAGLPLLLMTSLMDPWGGALTSVAGWIALAVLAGILFALGEIPTREKRHVSRET
jgi:membrane protease YdiL (CAAX protease family)